jgi:O-antigen/teichoic acid export membrane protein
MASLRDKTISGMFWSLLQNVGGRGVTFIVTIILARLLTPEAFGLIGMLMVFIQVSQTLIVSGFNQALIQKKDSDEEDYSTVFWINLTVSMGLYILLFITAPLIACFYKQPILIELTRALCIVFVINSFSYVQETRLMKKMQFKTLTIINIPSNIIGGVTSIIMASKGYGVWSIIALQVITRLAYAIQIWVYTKWSPLFIFRKERARGLFSYGSKLMLSQVIGTVFRNIYVVSLGKFFPLSIVGYYQNANNLVQYPTSTFTGALGSVTFPVFSSIQDDDKKLKEGYKKIIQQLVFWLCPAFVLAGVMAVPLFRLIFTEKWLPSVPYFYLLCIVGLFWPLNVYNVSIINIKGRSDLTLKLEVIKKMIILITLASSIFLGIWAVIITQVLNSIFAYFLNSYHSGKFINYPMREQLSDISAIILLSFEIGLLVFVTDYFISGLPDILRLLLGFGLGISTYWAIAKYKSLGPYLEFLNIFQSRFKKKFI